MPEGIDIYVANQTVTNWAQVKASDVDWCYQKVSDGLTTRSINPGPFAGVAQGGYHFSQPGSPVDQANLLVSQVQKYGLIDLNPALDLEDNPPSSGKANIPDSQKAAWAIAFGQQVLSHNHGFTLYANDSTWKVIYNLVMNNLPTTFRWVARYRTLPPDTLYDAWQYTSSGSCPGISTGSLDRNRGKKPLNTRGEVMTPEDIKAISEATVDQLMSREVSLGPNNDYLAAYSKWVWYVDRNAADTAMAIPQILAKLDILTQAVAKITEDPTITADNLRSWIDEAMATHKINITGTLQVGEDKTVS